MQSSIRFFRALHDIFIFVFKYIYTMERSIDNDQEIIAAEDQEMNPCDSPCLEDKYIFISEIRAMMYTFGDVKEPNQECVILMHRILRDQMDLLLVEAERTVILREDFEISHEDVLFLMRKKKMKLRRLIKYLQVLDSKLPFNNEFKVNKDDSTLPVANKMLLSTSGKSAKDCLKYLASIEDCKDLTSVIQNEAIIDNTVIMRRRHWMTKSDENEYNDFSETAKVSFCEGQNRTKFKNWLLQSEGTIFDLTDLAVTIINFLACETIAEIVDFALLTKMKSLGLGQHFDYHSFIHPIQSSYKQSEFNSEIRSSVITEEFQDVINEDEDDRAHSTSSSSNKACVISESYSKNQMAVTKECQACSEQNITLNKMGEDSNIANPQESDSQSPCSLNPQFNERSIVQEETWCKWLHKISEDFVTSGSDSNTKMHFDLNDCYPSDDDSKESQCSQLHLNQSSNEVAPNSFSNVFERSSAEASAPNQKKYKGELGNILSSVLKEGHVSNMTESADTDKSNEISNMSNTDLLNSCLQDSSQNSCPVFDSEETPTAVAGTSVQSQGTNSAENLSSIYDLEEISDTSDRECFAEEIMSSCQHQNSCKHNTRQNLCTADTCAVNSFLIDEKSCKHKTCSDYTPENTVQNLSIVDTSAGNSFSIDEKSCKQKTSPDYTPENTEQNPSIIDTSTASSLPVAEVNKLRHRTAITVRQIRLAFARVQAYSPMVDFFNIHPLYLDRRTKLVSLADSLSIIGL